MASDNLSSSLISYLGPLLSVAVGWFLHELSDVVRLRREDHRAAGKVLAELLEIRHRWRSLPAYITEIQKLFALPPEAHAIIRTVISQVLSPMLVRTEQRYNEAIDSIAGRMPLLAFQLRGKDVLRPALDQLQVLAGSDPAAIAALPTVESALTKEALPVLEELLLKFAWIHGFGTWLRLRHRLRKKEDFSGDVQRMLDSVLKAAGMSPPSAPPQSKP